MTTHLCSTCEPCERCGKVDCAGGAACVRSMCPVARCTNRTIPIPGVPEWWRVIDLPPLCRFHYSQALCGELPRSCIERD